MGVGGFGPDERLRLRVGPVDVGVDGGLKVGRAGEHAPLQASTGEEREPTLDQVEPGGRGRGEVQVPAWALDEPVVDELGLVGGRVVEHEVDVEVGRHRRLNLIQEGTELDCAMPPLAGADHRPAPLQPICSPSSNALAAAPTAWS